MNQPITDHSIGLAVEIAKAGMPVAAGTLLGHPETVAKFLEIVASKIEELRMQGSRS